MTPKFIQFLNELFPVKTDREIIIHYMQQSITFPDIAQIPLCLIGTPDCGKSIFLDLFRSMLSYNNQNLYTRLQIIDSFRLHSGFTFPWAGRNVVAIEATEIPQCTLDVISEIVEKKEIEVTAKNKLPYKINNSTTWILLSNKTKNFDNFNTLHLTIRLGKVTTTPCYWDCMLQNEIPLLINYLNPIYS